MWRYLRLIQMCAAVMFFTGCASIVPVAADKFPYEWKPDGSFCEPNSTACKHPTEYETLAERNHYQHMLLGIATQQCKEFKAALSSRRTVGLLAKIFSFTSSGAATVVSDEELAKRLTAAGSIGNAVDDEFEKLFAEKRLSLTLTGIEVARTRIFKQIIGSAKDDLIEYPVSRAINDALRYHSVCSRQAGLDESSRLVGAQYAKQIGADGD